jgi:hypothetical protein
MKQKQRDGNSKQVHQLEGYGGADIEGSVKLGIGLGPNPF